MPLMATFVVDHVVGGVNGMDQRFIIFFIAHYVLVCHQYSARMKS